MSALLFLLIASGPAPLPPYVTDYIFMDGNDYLFMNGDDFIFN